MQLALDSVLTEDRVERDRAADRYARQHLDVYYSFAVSNTPSLVDWRAIWDRVAFAILTANAETRYAVRAFHDARRFRSTAWPGCAVPGIVPERIRYVNALPKGKWALRLLRGSRESWHRYRLRLAEIDGLAITKASYAACLLYPMDADVACLDTWMLKYLRPDTSHFVSISVGEYVALEDRVRAFGRRHRISTAMAQWILWDFIRTGRPTPQDFFK